MAKPRTRGRLVTVLPLAEHARPPSHLGWQKGLVTAGQTDGQRGWPRLLKPTCPESRGLGDPGLPLWTWASSVGNSGSLTLCTSRWAWEAPWTLVGGALGGAGCLSASPGEWLAQGAAGETSLPALRGYGSEGMEVKKGTQGASLIPVVEGCCHPPSYRWRWLQPPVAAFDQSRWREGRKGLTDTPEPPHTRPPSSSPCRKGSRCSPFLSDAPNMATLTPTIRAVVRAIPSSGMSLLPSSQSPEPLFS